MLKNIHKNKSFLIFAGVSVAVLLVIATLSLLSRIIDSTPESNTPQKEYQSYSIQEVTEVVGDLIKKNETTPPEAALYYAYVSSVYADVYQNSSDASTASKAALLVMEEIYSNDKQIIRDSLEGEFRSLSAESQDVVDTYINRLGKDGHHEMFKGKVPEGTSKWVQRPDRILPLSPLAGTWKRWVITDEDQLDVEQPFSAEFYPELYQEELTKTQQVVATSGPVQVNLINYWGGTPGTKTPSGIWLDTWYETVKDDELREEDLIKHQKILTQAMSDAFMEAWKVKYTHWTERPSMLDPELQLEMDDPDFPAYVSGHTTVSFAASTVLSQLHPKHAEIFGEHAKNAKDSRVFAGVHFPMDNIAGEKLGREVGNLALKSFGLEQVEFVDSLTIMPSQEKLDAIETERAKQAEATRLKKELEDSIIARGSFTPEITKASKTQDDLGVASLYRVSSTKDSEFKPTYVAGKGDIRLKDGYTYEKLNEDQYWNPGACASLPSVVLPQYIASLEGAPSQAFNLVDTVWLSIYDLENDEFIYLYNEGLGDYIVDNYLEKVSDNEVAMYFYDVPEQIIEFFPPTPVNKQVGQNNAVRRVINIQDGTYIDYLIEKSEDQRAYISANTDGLLPIKGFEIKEDKALLNGQIVTTYNLREGLYTYYGDSYDNILLINTAISSFSSNIMRINVQTGEIDLLFDTEYRTLPIEERDFSSGEVEVNFEFVHLN
ncbi:MAG: hypothetical protein AAGF07_05040 [Patescibacteria group bacterium]